MHNPHADIINGIIVTLHYFNPIKILHNPHYEVLLVFMELAVVLQ